MKRFAAVLTLVSLVRMPASALGASTAPDRCAVAHPAARIVLPGNCDTLGLPWSAEPRFPDGPGAPATPGCFFPTIDDWCERWVDAYDGPGNDMDVPGDGGLLATRPLAVAPDGRTAFVVATSDAAPGTSTVDYDAAILAYDVATGNRRWATRYPGTEQEPSVLTYAVAVSPDGATVYALVEGSACGSTVVALDAATGEERWIYRRPGCGLILSLAVAPDGGTVYLGGTGRPIGDPAARSGLYVLAIDSQDGGPAWEGHEPGPEQSLGFTGMVMGLAPDGKTVYVAGGEKRADGLRKDFTVAAFDAHADEEEDELGDLLWLAQDPVFQPEGFFGNNGAVGIAISPDSSRVFIHGIDPFSSGSFFGGGDNTALLTYAHDAVTGERLWGRRFTGPDGELNHHFVLVEGTIGVSPDGNLVHVTGYHATETTSGAMQGTNTVTYDAATGEELWAATSRDTHRFSLFFGFYPSLEVSQAGDLVFVTSPRGNRNVSNYVTLAYEATTGVQRWVGRFGRSNGYPTTVAATPDGKRVLVTGMAKPVEHCIPFVCPDFPTPNSYDVVTVAYDT